MDNQVIQVPELAKTPWGRMLQGFSYLVNAPRRLATRRFGKAFTKPMCVEIMLDRKCNLDCIHCVVDKAFKEDTLSTDEYLSLIDDLGRWGVKQVSFGGGEPFVNQELGRIFEATTRYNMKVGFSTNGILLTSKNVALIHEHGINRVTVSIDGIGSTHDEIRGENTFEKTLKGLERLVALKDRYGYPEVRVNTVILEKNYHDFTKIYKLAKRKKIKLNFMPFITGGVQKEGEVTFNNDQVKQLFPSQHSVRKIEKLLRWFLASKIKDGIVFNTDTFLELLILYLQKKIVKKTCKKSTYEIGILSNGNVTFCGQSEFLGNIRNHSVKDIWFSKKAMRNRNKLKDCNGCFVNCNYSPPLGDLLKDFLLYPVRRFFTR